MNRSNQRIASIIWACLLIGLTVKAGSGCKTTEAPTPPRTTEVLFLSTPDPGTLSVRATGYGDDVDAAVQHAEEQAFWTLLFRGVPGSTQAQALVAEAMQGQTEEAPYFRAFFEDKRYLTFVVESALAEAPEQVKRSGRAVVDLTINLYALRRDLEQHGVIRRFGFQ